MKEAQLVDTGAGLRPEGEGWFVLSARDAHWERSEEFGRYTRWEGDGEARFKEIGINISVLEPGQPMCMYHGEDAQEDFLVLAGEGMLIIEGEERPLKAWDFVHCPAWANHVIVATGAGATRRSRRGRSQRSSGAALPARRGSAEAQRRYRTRDAERRRGICGNVCPGPSPVSRGRPALANRDVAGREPPAPPSVRLVA